jgi:serine protease AprX
MSKKQVIVHVMHEYETLSALKVMTDSEETESFVFGEIEENDIKKLRDQGLIVQEVGGETSDGPTARDISFGQTEESVRTVFSQNRSWTERGSDDIPQAGYNVYLIQLNGPLMDSWRAELEASGVKLLESVPPFSFTAKIDSSNLAVVQALKCVARIRLYDSEDTMAYKASDIERERGASTPRGSLESASMMTFDIRLHSSEDADNIMTWLEERSISIAGAKRDKVRVYLMAGSPLIGQLAALPEVAIVEEYVVPKLLNNVARELLGIDPAPSNNVTLASPFTGRGEIIAVADTGLDDNHPDFQGRIIASVALGRAGLADDPHGHGTHVAGSVLGDGTASGGVVRGTAPEAELYFQSLLDTGGGLGGLPLHLEDLFDPAYQAGARIHNNSWGAATNSRYTMNSLEVDEYVADNRDMLVVIAAGNEGTAATTVNSNNGFVDWLSIGSPASSKNALTVGASRSDRSNVGLSSLTWGTAWPNDFPQAPIANENISGNTEAMAAFSSRGPTDDRRIKPDLVAPGTDIASPKSTLAPLRNFWGPYPGNSDYAYMGGTSMAAPLVAGCAATVREYYRTQRTHDPSAALLKASLINSTRWLTAADSQADHQTNPNFHQGFGAVNMVSAIPNQDAPNMDLEFVDNWQSPADHFVRNGARKRYQFTVSAGTPLRICLTWTDPPGRALQHDLNLFLQDLGTQTKWIGNQDLPLRISQTDPENNVEIIRIDNPTAGNYMILVSAMNLLHGPQDFALVVTGDITGLTSV